MARHAPRRNGARTARHRPWVGGYNKLTCALASPALSFELPWATSVGVTRPTEPALVASPSRPFEILEVLGEGAFGAVCVARIPDDPLRRRVAIKVLKAEYASNPKILNRTRDEARLLSKLQHPNIVRVEQLIEIQGRPVLVMELVQGMSLNHLVERFPRGIPPSIAMEVIRQTCIALHVAYHEALNEDGRPLCVIHRDIKPSNMLLSVHGELKVVDFGIATGKFSERESETESVVMGSRPYMAPERLDGAADTPAVDVYSAGMTLFELLTGRTMTLSINPSTHDRAMSRQLDHLNVQGLGDQGSEDIRQLVRRMCSYDVDFRPTARDVAIELGRLVGRMDGEKYISLTDFASDVVERMYNERPRNRVSPAVTELEESGLAVGAPASDTAEHAIRAHRRARLLDGPGLFLAMLAVLVLSLAGMAGVKVRADALEVTRSRAERQMARLKIWIPRDAKARIGNTSIALPGHMDVRRGPHDLVLFFDDGRVLTCAFTAKSGTAIRYVVEQGKGGISIDDGPAVLCEEPTAAR